MLLSILLEVVNVSYPKLITNIGDDQFYFHFNFLYKKRSPYKAKALRPFDPIQNHSSEHFYYSFLGCNNETEIVLNKVKILAGVYTLEQILRFIKDKTEEYRILFNEQENGKVKLAWNSSFDLYVLQQSHQGLHPGSST